MRCRWLLAAAALLHLAPAAAANLLVNGSFEAGNFSGWTLVFPGDFTFVACGPFGLSGLPELSATDGGCHGLFSSSQATGIKQSFATLPGRTYRISYDLTNVDFSEKAAYAVSFETLPIASGGPQDIFFKKHFSFDRVANGTTGVLEFGFQSPAYWFSLDNVSVVAVPEPAVWATLIGGFAATGLVMRSRRRALSRSGQAGAQQSA